MRKFILKGIGLFIVLTYSICFNLMAQYHDDILGNGYQCRTIEQPDDYDGKVVCTIVKKEVKERTNCAIIYVHGYNDYFFQQELGDSITTHGYNFYAVDLRKYGRSILPNQDPFYCKKMDEYFADIDTTIAVARAEGNDHIILMGHSTGCLSLTLYLDKMQEKAKIDALILNSPFFDWYMSKTMENILIPFGSGLGAIFKRIKVYGTSEEAGCYAQSLHKDYHGEWDYNTAWKKHEGHPKRTGWVRAIHRGHKRVQRGVAIQCPILVMSSDTSMVETNEWKEDFKRADIVLDVSEIHRFGENIGPHTKHVRIPGGIHDLILSPQPARGLAYKAIFDFLNSIREEKKTM